MVSGSSNSIQKVAFSSVMGQICLSATWTATFQKTCMNLLVLASPVLCKKVLETWLESIGGQYTSLRKRTAAYVFYICCYAEGKCLQIYLSVFRISRIPDFI